MAEWKGMIEEIKKQAKNLLREGKVDTIIGYQSSLQDGYVTPCFIKNEEDAEKLIWNERCFYNLSRYLIEVKGKVGIVSKGCDVKSIIGLIQEHRVVREDIVIIGVECWGVKIDGKNAAIKCGYCNVHQPKIYDILIPSEKKEEPQQINPYKEVEDLEGKSLEERWEYWQKELGKCIKCYACRQICPLCHCLECITDQTIPQWILPSTSEKGDTAWNLIRAFHLAGRCIECEECERACPMNIPLMKLNRKMQKEIKEMFGYEAGSDSETKLPLSDFRMDDPQEFIK